MRNLIFLLLFPTIFFGQEKTSETTTKTEEVIRGNTIITTVTETTINYLPTEHKIIKTTITTETKNADGTKKVDKIVDSKIESNVIVPPTIKDYDTYEKANIDIIKSEIKDYKFQITYIDRSDDRVKIFESPIEKNTYYSNATHKWIRNPLSIITVPVKIRPAILNLKQSANPDVNNIGIFWPVFQSKISRIFPNSKTSEHRFGIGPLLSPMIEEFNEDNNDKVTVGKTVNNIILSTGLVGSYSYNGITFAIIPAGVDFGLTTMAKHWKYRGKYWYGFGIGIDTKILGF